VIIEVFGSDGKYFFFTGVVILNTSL
jgi:hypothetical protein